VRGRQQQFEQTALPHTRSLLLFARRLAGDGVTAEDMVQETLLRAWRSFHQFEAGTNVRAWLFRILVNVSNARGRKVARTLETVPLEREPASPAPIRPSERMELIEALDQLPVEQRTALMLAAVEGFTCREIAEILSIPIGTVMSRVGRAREAMRARLAPEPSALAAACSRKESR